MVTKQDYKKPFVSVIVFQAEDVITASGEIGDVTSNGADNLGRWIWEEEQ